MTTTDWITVAAIVIGPIVAVAITLWIEKRRKEHDAKLITLRLLLTTRDFPSDPNFQIAIKLVPVEFNRCPSVLAAHREFLDAANVDTDGKSDDQIKAIADNTSLKLVRLIFEVSQATGLKIRETDIQAGRFGTKGFFYRDALAQDSQRAMRDIANILWMQTRLLAGESWQQVNSQPAEGQKSLQIPEPEAPKNADA